MPVITEGKHKFNFPDADGWYAFKYDDIDPANAGFYRERIEKIKIKGSEEKPGEGIKVVDIVAGIRPEFRELTLLEIKDFRDDEPGLKRKIITSEIPIDIAQKALHTWGALCLGARHKDELLPPDLCAGILHQPERLRVVFFLAQKPIQQSPNERDTKQREQTRRVQRQDILKKLQEKLKPLGIKSDLADLHDLPVRCGWTVTELP